MNKLAKVGIIALPVVATAGFITAAVASRREKKKQQLLAFAKNHFMADEVVVAWLQEEPVDNDVYQGGLVGMFNGVERTIEFEVNGKNMSVKELENVEGVE
jgi:hypothetical protein